MDSPTRIPASLLFCSIPAILLFVSAAAAPPPTAINNSQPPHDTSTPTVAVTVQGSAATSKSSHVIAHAVCFSDSNNVPACEEDDPNGGDDSVEIAATACCDAMKRAVRFLCLQVQTNTGEGYMYDSSSFLLVNHSICRGLDTNADDSRVAASWEQSCTEHIASIPNYYYSPGVDVDDELMAPTHLLSIWEEEI